MPGSQSSVADQYHRLTRYTEENVRGGPGLDWSTQPQQIKEIVSEHRLSLRPYAPIRGWGEETAAGAEPQEEAPGLGIAKLSRLLFFTNGITGLIRYRPGAGQFLRAAPSAGALYPTETYVCVRDVPGVEPGLYNYQPPAHELVRLWEGDQLDALRSACGDDPRFEGARLCLVFTGLFWRSAWRYRERGYRRVLLDTGHVIANLAAYAPFAGCTAHPFLGFMDAEVNGLFFFDDAVEAALACVPLTEEVSPCVPGALWTSPVANGAAVAAAELAGPADLRQSAGIRLHRAAACTEKRLAEDADAVAPQVSNRSIPLPPPAGLYPEVQRAILDRRSARRYRGTAISLAKLGEALGFAFGRNPHRRAAHFATRDAGLLRAHVIATRVDGLDAGLYAVEGAGEALLPLSIGDFREAVAHVSLDQEIALKAAATLVLSAAPAPALELYGERAYRYLHLEAGEIGERFQLAATVLKVGACGIGGFLDEEAARLVEVPARDWILYLVTLGRP